MKSIEDEGVLVPLLIRPNPDGEGYEVIAGHRRKAAAQWAGFAEVPAVIRELDDNQAVVAMVDSNLQRENLKPSEKAFAYKMKLEAMKRQGARTDLTSSQVGKKLTSSQAVAETSVNANEALAKQVGESRMTIQRYIRLTNLIPKVLDMVDDGKIAFTIAVEISGRLQRCSSFLEIDIRLQKQYKKTLENFIEFRVAQMEEKDNDITVIRDVKPALQVNQNVELSDEEKNLSIILQEDYENGFHRSSQHC